MMGLTLKDQGGSWSKYKRNGHAMSHVLKHEESQDDGDIIVETKN